MMQLPICFILAPSLLKLIREFCLNMVNVNINDMKSTPFCLAIVSKYLRPGNFLSFWSFYDSNYTVKFIITPLLFLRILSIFRLTHNLIYFYAKFLYKNLYYIDKVHIFLHAHVKRKQKIHRSKNLIQQSWNYYEQL